MVRIVLIALCVLFATPAWGEIYKWVDEKGKTHFTDDLRKVPADQRPEKPSQPAPPEIPVLRQKKNQPKPVQGEARPPKAQSKSST